MRIALNSWAPFYAGAEVAALRLAVGLRDAGQEVVCVVGTEGELLGKLRQEGIQTYYVPQRFTDKWKWLSYRRSRNELIKIFKDERPDVVHSNDLPTHQLVSDAARRVGLPRVCHHRWIFEGSAIDWLNKFGAERHVFVSRALMGELCAASGRLGRESGRNEISCEVVYDGLPLPRLGEERSEGGGQATGDRGQGAGGRAAAKRELSLDVTKQLVLFAGQIIERKGVAEVLRAWAKLKPRWEQQADLVVVGDDLEGKGAYRAEMEALASELDCGARFVGFQKNVPVWLKAADMVLVPSHAEPLGNATLEAMAYSRPVIGTHVGGIPEMVVDGETGLLVQPRDPVGLAGAMERLLFDAGLRERLGQAGRRRCEEMFSLEAHVRAMVRQYELAIEAGRLGIIGGRAARGRLVGASA